jgi:lipopolysaccharide/colanic/teichoic acid biosynthesis glycosyltransferase
VRLSSRGPGFFRQRRVGLRGREFMLIKLRTMRTDAERGTGAVWAKQDDPRCTPLGRVMRHLHLDEFPQLINVIFGDMSLVGPRPERPEFVVRLQREVPGYNDRHMVRPGITGLAQILLPPDRDTHDVRRKVVVDRHYIRHCGFWLDIRLLMFTGLRLLRLPVSWCNWLAPLPALETIPDLPDRPDVASDTAMAASDVPFVAAPPPPATRTKPGSRPAIPVSAPVLARQDITPLPDRGSLTGPGSTL